MSFADVAAEQIRRLVLELLEADPDYEHNEEVIRRALEPWGHHLSRDKLRTELHWLAEQGLVGITPMPQTDLLLARLTARGEDVALGRARVPGVARRRPEG